MTEEEETEYETQFLLSQPESSNDEKAMHELELLAINQLKNIYLVILLMQMRTQRWHNLTEV